LGEILYNHPTNHALRVLDLETRAREYLLPPLYKGAEVGDFEYGALNRWNGSEYIACDSDYIRAFVAAGPRDVLIQGEPGRGKSHLAAALAAQWFSYWIRLTSYLAKIRSSFRGQINEEALVHDWGGREVLVIDDITAANTTDFSVSATLDLISERIENENPTIVTTYQPLDWIQENVTARS